jgi:hypothetical protein
MFRDVGLPEGVAGRLYLHSMPGRYEPLSGLLKRCGNFASGGSSGWLPWMRSKESHRRILRLFGKGGSLGLTRGWM